jgi:GT2 family glycosyltransferase
MLTHNNLDTTKKCLESFISSTKIPCQLIIIDNASSDGTPQYLLSLQNKKDYPLKVILNGENKGFIRGINQGIAISKAPYVCLANNDLIFTTGWLDEIILLFEKNSQIGILNPNSNNLGVLPISGASLAEFSEKLRKKYSGVFIEMPFDIGFCMVIRRELIDKIGGLAEELCPMFFEDSDYSLRAHQAGYLVGVARGSYVLHKEHVSISQLGPEKEEIFKRSRKTYLKKWGKALRIAWILDSYEKVKSNLLEAIRLAREGNYIWFFTREELIREDIFKASHFFEHSGIQFIKFKNFVDLAWKIFKKKKKYDLIITDSNFLQKVFRKLNYNVDSLADKEVINKIKFFDKEVKL